MIKINVVAGIAIRDTKVFIARRKKGKDYSGMWEFPGGKVNTNETNEEALTREFKEEFNAHIKVKKYLKTGEDISSKKHILLHGYLIEIKSNIEFLFDHDLTKWIPLNEIINYEMPPADKPIAEEILKIHLSNI